MGGGVGWRGSERAKMPTLSAPSKHTRTPDTLTSIALHSRLSAITLFEVFLHILHEHQGETWGGGGGGGRAGEEGGFVFGGGG